MFSCVHDQTIVRSKWPMSRLSRVQSYLWSDYRAFQVAYVQTIVRSKLHMSRLSCVQNCTCPDYRAFKIAYVQTIVRSKLHMSRLSCVHFFFPDRVILNARRHLVRSFRSGHIDFRSGTSTWVWIVYNIFLLSGDTLRLYTQSYHLSSKTRDSHVSQQVMAEYYYILAFNFPDSVKSWTSDFLWMRFDMNYVFHKKETLMMILRGNLC